MTCHVTRILLACCFALPGWSQDVIPLPVKGGTAAVESYPEKQYFSKVWNTEVVSNVTKPSLTVFKPTQGPAKGVGIVVCPGGGFLALSIASEGTEVAKWLAARGVTAFILKYRLAHSGEDATVEFQQMLQDRARKEEIRKNIVPLSIADGITAMAYVRSHAAEWGLDQNKIGIVGFSAGGTVAAGVALRYTPESRPAFAAPIYAAVGALKEAQLPADAPPLFVAAATDDQLGLAPDSTGLYEKWAAAHKPAELHMYAKGGHGFGMRRQNLPSDEWISHFWNWLETENVLPLP